MHTMIQFNICILSVCHHIIPTGVGPDHSGSIYSGQEGRGMYSYLFPTSFHVPSFQLQQITFSAT